MIKHRKIFYIVSGSMVLISIAVFMVFGLNFGIDFTGGTLMEVEFRPQENATTTFSLPNHDSLRADLKGAGLGEVVIQNVGGKGLILRFAVSDELTHQNVLNVLRQYGELEELRFESVGPIIGRETKEKSLWAIALVSLLILVYVAWAFKKVSYPVSSWQYGAVALIALLHDILITIGAMAVIGHFFKMEAGVPFVAALLTILGYSVNDTIVIFDRIRENLLKQGGSIDFETLINKSLRETYARSFNTGLTTLLVLFAVLAFGSQSTEHFVITLIIGIVVGTYSSIFLASPLLFSLAMVKRGRGRPALTRRGSRIA